MRQPVAAASRETGVPVMVQESQLLIDALQTLTITEIQQMMKISPKLAEETRALIHHWTDEPGLQRMAVNSFLGDIYSGLQAHSWNEDDRQYAQEHLRIISGLYGILRPQDGIYPYRLEMGYKIPNQEFKNMYEFWGKKIANALPEEEPIINLTALEYGKTVTKYIARDRIITPRFLTVSPKTGQPNFVTVHAKIARGAFANWMITSRIDSTNKIGEFADLGYTYSSEMSSVVEPVFVCQAFHGLGLSIRQT